MKKRSYQLIIALAIILLASGLIYQNRSQSQSKQHQYVQSHTPTLFFHGGGSNYHAEEYMVNAAVKAGVTKTVVRAFVDQNGKVTLKGHLSGQAINPIVEVNYADNRSVDFKQYGQYATNVVRKLETVYHFKQINMVGHSAGNISLIYYELLNGNKANMPKIKRQVDIAGHFAGLKFANVPPAIRQPSHLQLDKKGRPHPMNASYREMTKVRQLYAKKQLAVLNIIGDVGDQTDGTVANVSTRSLKYLVQPGVSHYEVMKVNGKQAQHSKLHHNQQVNRKLIQFIWAK
nr:alpha/beta hydrolase [Latilactobacillus fragifolii]